MSIEKTLNSKTYFCWNDNEDGDEDTDKVSKCSSKGLSKNTNKLTKRCFFDVLNTKRSKTGTNKGFVKRGGRMLTYTQ